MAPRWAATATPPAWMRGPASRPGASRQALTADLPAGALVAQPAPLRGVEHHVQHSGDGHRGRDHGDGQPRADDEQDEPDDDTGDAVLHVGRHADSFSGGTPGPALPDS